MSIIKKCIDNYQHLRYNPVVIVYKFADGKVGLQ